MTGRNTKRRQSDRVTEFNIGDVNERLAAIKP